MEKDLDKILEYTEQFLKEYDCSQIVKKAEQILWYVPIPDHWEQHTMEDWFETEDYDFEEHIHWKIPTKEQLEFILFDIISNSLWQNYEMNFYGLKIKIKGEYSVELDLSWFDQQIKLLKDMRELYKYDIENVLPTKKYVGNCSKEFCELIVEQFWEREFERIQYIDFPPVEFNIPTKEKCIKEYKRLLKEEGVLNSKNISNIVKYFHTSMNRASTSKNLSPLDGWKKIQSDEHAFKEFYRNRLRCSDWFKGKERLDYLLRGVVMENTYGIGLSTSRKYQFVTYFKPRLAKYIIDKYLSEYNTVFDPFSGYSGRMLGALSLGKNYIGQDLCKSSVEESKQIVQFLKEQFDIKQRVELSVKNSVTSYGEYQCLFTCPPYNDIEKWPGVKSVNFSCDKWIDICLTHYKCDKYVFVVDDTIKKYKDFIVETITNTSHFKENHEYIVVINKEDLRKFTFDIEGDIIESDFKSTYSELGEKIYNIFNQKYFNQRIEFPICFGDWIELIYNKFEQENPTIFNTPISKIYLPENKKDVLLACSGGLDSIYQYFQLKQQGYNVILYHLRNANFYENGQSHNSINEFAKKYNVKLVEPILHQTHDKYYSKYWHENPVKNQMIVLTMIDYCYENGINQIAIDGSWDIPISQTTAGIDVTDAPENCDYFIESLKMYVSGLEYIRTPFVNKADKIKYLYENRVMDNIYSCLGPGKFNQYRHECAEEKYGVKLFKYNCGCSCRKCAHHNLLLYYSGIKEFPQEFIEKCWNTMSENGFPSRKFLFDKKLPLETRIKNLYFE